MRLGLEAVRGVEVERGRCGLRVGEVEAEGEGKARGLRWRMMGRMWM